MNDIRRMYLDVIESGSIAMLSSVIEQQELQHLPIISDRDIQIMQWVVKKMPVRNSNVATREFLSFLIQLKGAVEARQLKEAEAQDAELLLLMADEWLRKFDEHGSTDAAKSEVVPMVSTLSKSERFKKIINDSYQIAKKKWAHKNHPG